MWFFYEVFSRMNTTYFGLFVSFLFIPTTVQEITKVNPSVSPGQKDFFSMEILHEIIYQRFGGIAWVHVWTSWWQFPFGKMKNLSLSIFPLLFQTSTLTFECPGRRLAENTFRRSRRKVNSTNCQLFGCDSWSFFWIILYKKVWFVPSCKAKQHLFSEKLAVLHLLEVLRDGGRERKKEKRWNSKHQAGFEPMISW